MRFNTCSIQTLHERKPLQANLKSFYIINNCKTKSRKQNLKISDITTFSRKINIYLVLCEYWINHVCFRADYHWKYGYQCAFCKGLLKEYCAVWRILSMIKEDRFRQLRKSYSKSKGGYIPSRCSRKNEGVYHYIIIGEAAEMV